MQELAYALVISAVMGAAVAALGFLYVCMQDPHRLLEAKPGSLLSMHTENSQPQVVALVARYALRNGFTLHYADSERGVVIFGSPVSFTHFGLPSAIYVSSSEGTTLVEVGVLPNLFLTRRATVRANRALLATIAALLEYGL